MANKGTWSYRDNSSRLSDHLPETESESFYEDPIIPETEEVAKFNEVSSVPINAEDIENQVSWMTKFEELQLCSTSKPESKMLWQILTDKGNMVESQLHCRKVPEKIPVSWKEKVEEVQLCNTSETELKDNAEKGSEDETVANITRHYPKAQEVITTACWSLIEYKLPEYPLQRNAIPIREMIKEVDEMQKHFRMHGNISYKDDIITLFEILYVLEIESLLPTLAQMKEVCKMIRSTESEGTETKPRNLYSALKYVHELTQSEVEQKYHGLIDVDCFVLKMHRLILGPENEGGMFSTDDRYGLVDQHTRKVHKYPKFESEDDVRDTVQIVIDHYNALLDEIKLSYMYHKDSKNAIEKLFKLSGMLLFKITYYHPFGDGNGRLARLLSSYALSLFTPFPTPTYGLFSPSTREEYVDALIEARENNNIPSTLTALIIESSYYTWKKFDKVVKMARNVGTIDTVVQMARDAGTIDTVVKIANGETIDTVVKLIRDAGTIDTVVKMARDAGTIDTVVKMARDAGTIDTVVKMARDVGTNLEGVTS